MSTVEREPDLDAALTGLSALAVSLVATLAYAAFWLWFGLVALPFGIPSTFYLLGAVALVQAVRVARMDDGRRRAAAAGVVLGFLVTIAGLAPGGACPGTGSCTTELNPNPLLLAGFGLLTLSVYVDLRGYVLGFGDQ